MPENEKAKNSQIIKMTEEELQQKISEAVAMALKAHETAQKTVVVSPEETVTLIFIGGIAPGTVVPIGKMGQILYDGGSIDIPKRQFLQGIDSQIRILLDERKLMVVDGLTEEERKRYSLPYSEEDMLTVEKYQHLLEYDVDKIADIFSKLCEQHKKIFAKAIYTAYANADPRVTLEKMRALNRISKQTNKTGLFTNIINDIGRNIAKEDSDISDD